MIPCSERPIREKVDQADYLWLFLDYDGTLADFAATPDVLIPDEELIGLIAQLAGKPDVRISIISG